MSTEIRPSNINTNRHFFDTFGHTETETSATWVVRFCQQRDGDDWRPFAHADLLAFYREGRLGAIRRQHEKKGRKPPETCGETFCYNGLIGRWIYEGGDGLVHITKAFIIRCFNSSPLVELPGCSPDKGSILRGRA